MKEMIGYCGIDCEQCDVYLATVNRDEALRERTAKKWSELNQVEITPAMLYCDGCRADGVKTYYCSELCAIRRCAAGRGYATCGECAGLEHCATVAPIHSHNSEAKHNLQS